jgi:hypothetical protein
MLKSAARLRASLQTDAKLWNNNFDPRPAAAAHLLLAPECGDNCFTHEGSDEPAMGENSRAKEHTGNLIGLNDTTYATKRSYDWTLTLYSRDRKQAEYYLALRCIHRLALELI